jgi:hypothetical protein
MLDAIGGFLLAILVIVGIGIAIAFGIAIVLACALLTTLIGVIWLPAQYFTVMAKRIVAEPGEISLMESTRIGKALRVAGHLDQERSFPHYFFGPVEIDMRSIISDSSDRIDASLRSGWKIGTDLFSEGPGYFGQTAGVGILIGLIPGGICGMAVTALVVVINIVLTAVSAALAALMSIILRGLDTTMRFVAGIHLTCPICAQAVHPYAAYKCPSCGELHRDIRPGRRGVLGRICRCGYRIPTLLLVGAVRLAAVCPECGSALPRRFGKIPIIVIPFFGSVKAGKTQLIYTLVLALRALITASGGAVEIHGDTRHELDRIGERLAINGSPRPTVAKSPEAFVMRIKIGLNERYIYLFDPAGELHYRTDTLDELHYFDKANTMVFVADPLAAEGVWEQLSAEQNDYSRIRSNWVEAELAYELPREQMRQMGTKGRLTRLAFVVTKKDILTKAGICHEKRDSVRKFVSAADGMDMGNLVREAERSFADVGFFQTAAITDEADVPDISIEALAIWLMRSEGIILSGVSNDD